jgi:hypothetical protein
VPDAPVTTDRGAIEDLRTALDRAGYGSAELERRLELDGPFSLDWGSLPVYVRQLSDGSAFAAVTKLFLLGAPVAPAEVEEALHPLTVPRLAELGLADMEGEDVVASIAILPWSGFWLASDPLEKELPPTRPDYVLSVIPPSVTLASLTPRRPVASTLDVGVGSGVQSLLASRHSERVVGVDVNPRALAYAELNLLLNRIENVELRKGDAFDAVGADERFDLVLSNPPYVISPESHYAFRDSGKRGDAFCEELVRRAPAFLADGGLAQLLVGWAETPGEDWSAPLRRWVEGSGCDALAFHFLSQDPLAYAAMWNRHLRWEPLGYDRAIERWLEYLEELAIESVAWGALTLRKRRAARHWFAPYPTSMASLDEAGHHVDRMIAAHDRLHGNGDLLAERLRLADDHRLDQTMVLRDRGGSVQKAVLRLEGGFNFEAALSRDAFQLLSQLDGRTVDEVLADLAARIEGADAAELRAQALPTVKGLFELGFLVAEERP